MIGIGPLEQKLKQLVDEKNLANNVNFLGAMPPEKVRTYMENSDIFWFTSDFNEGWGAVLNEAMNSGCAVVASYAIGSVPFLLKHKQNGLIYKNADDDDLFNKTVYLIENPSERLNMGKAAYKTITELWNAETAARRLLDLYEILKQGKTPEFTSGPCSIAKPILQKDMYDYLTRN